MNTKGQNGIHSFCDIPLNKRINTFANRYHMIKTCQSCGHENPDKATFCASCGARLQDNLFKPQSQQPIEYNKFQPQREFQPQARFQPQPQVKGRDAGVSETDSLSVELQSGEDENVPSIVYLKDRQDRRVITARAKLPLECNFELLDSDDHILGYVTHEGTSSRGTFSVTDSQRTPAGRVRYKILGPLTLEHGFWIEDANEKKVIDVARNIPKTGFTLTLGSTNQTVAMINSEPAKAEPGEPKSQNRGKYTVRLFGNELGPLLLAGFIITIECLKTPRST